MPPSRRTAPPVDATPDARPDARTASPAGPPPVVVLTGLSGAGKTTALHALEDLGFFACDNVPPSLWRALASRVALEGGRRLAVGLDVRAGPFLDELELGLAELGELDVRTEVVFLDAADETLVRRYNLTRRTHPLGEGTLSSDFEEERRRLEPLRSRADRVIDTTRLSVRELREVLRERYAGARPFRLRLLSFGFKRGAPVDADVVLDVRTMPNPYYEPALRALPGTEPDVQAHVFAPAGLELYAQLRGTIRTLAALAEGSGRSGYTVAIGCTGGQHRSVAVVERLREDLADRFDARVEHRDVEAALEEHR